MITNWFDGICVSRFFFSCYFFSLFDQISNWQVSSKENITSLSALEVAEQMTYLDQKIMFTIMSSEFLGQSWLKGEKNELSPHIVIMTKRFNDVSYLSEKLREIESTKKNFFRSFFRCLDW